MAYRVLIPTPLRPYTDQQDAVEVDGSTVGELLSSLTARYGELRRHLYSDEGKLRSFVNVYVNDDDIRYLDREATSLKAGDVVSIVPSVAGGAPVATPDDAARADQRRSAALQPPPDPARGGAGRPAPAQGRPRALCRRRGPRFAGGAVSRGRGRRHHRHHRLRCRRRQQPAAADPARHAGRRPLQAAVGEGSAGRAEPDRQGRVLRDRADLEERARAVQASTTSSSTAPTTSRPATWSTTPASSSASRTPTAASSGSKGRPRCSPPRAGRAIAACIRSRRLPGSCRAARKAGCSACCPA